MRRLAKTITHRRHEENVNAAQPGIMCRLFISYMTVLVEPLLGDDNSYFRCWSIEASSNSRKPLPPLDPLQRLVEGEYASPRAGSRHTATASMESGSTLIFGGPHQLLDHVGS